MNIAKYLLEYLSTRISEYWLDFTRVPARLYQIECCGGAWSIGRDHPVGAQTMPGCLYTI